MTGKGTAYVFGTCTRACNAERDVVILDSSPRAMYFYSPSRNDDQKRACKGRTTRQSEEQDYVRTQDKMEEIHERRRNEDLNAREKIHKYQN